MSPCPEETPRLLSRQTADSASLRASRAARAFGREAPGAGSFLLALSRTSVARLRPPQLRELVRSTGRGEVMLSK